jgi:uncharacterized protein (TIGR04255 family)
MAKEYLDDSSIHYDHAPIVEAILDASIQRVTPVQMEELAEVVLDKEKYPHRVELITASGQMTVGSTVSASTTTQKIGYQFFRADKKVVVQCRVDGLAVSRLAPYLNWEDVYAEYARHWNRYMEIVTPNEVTQLAVRYVNRFDLPGNRVELSDYFRTYPEISPDIKYDLSGFLNQMHIPMPDIDGQAIITQARVPPPNHSVISVLLDIAVSMAMQTPASELNLESKMSILRSRKNELFEACMKKQARELIREASK